MMDFTVTPDGGDPYEVKATSRDVLVWERTNRAKKVFSTLMEQLSMVDLYHLCWIACRRLGLFSGDLATFEQTCEVNPDTEEEQEGPDPTQPVPSTEP
jgi:hypothetical protein